MDFGLNEEQVLIKENARRFFQKELPGQKIKELQASETGFSPELWDKIVQAGWLGLAFPEEYGGAGCTLMDLAVLYEECGRGLMPTVFYSDLAAGLVILNGGAAEQKKKYLPRLVNGEILVTLALYEPCALHDLNLLTTRADLRHGRYFLSGTKLFVQNAVSAHYLLVVAKTGIASEKESIALFLVDTRSKGISCTPLHTFGLDPQSEVVFEGVEVGPEHILCLGSDGKEALARTLEQVTALQCVEMAGGAQQVLEMTTKYVRERIQFNRPIGSFQAVQHHLANMAITVEGARYVAYQAVWRAAEGLPCTKEVSIAKAWTGDVYKNATIIAHQLHGGIGYTLEYDLYLYSNRAKATELWLGNRDYHLEIVARELGI